jgi:CheY-like chemotaxis protein
MMGPRQNSVQPARVLLVDDDHVTAVFVENVFDQIPCLELMDVAKDGVEAMALLRQEGQHANAGLPDLVLLDINMPRKDGFAVLSEMGQDPELRKIPVIMFTTSDLQADIHKAYARGANAFITKPINIDELGQAMTRFADFWVNTAEIPELTGDDNPSQAPHSAEAGD